MTISCIVRQMASNMSANTDAPASLPASPSFTGRRLPLRYLA